MRFRDTGALLLSATSALALKDASPFVLISSPPLNSHDAIASQQIATADSIEDSVLEALSSCAHKQYFVVSQPGVTTEDLQNERNFPKLRRRAISRDGNFVQIPEVIGAMDGERMASSLAASCGVQEIEASNYATPQAQINGKSAVVRVELSQKESLAFNDDYLDSYINNSTKKDDAYVLIFTSTSQSSERPLPYEFDEPYPSALHTDLKRHVQEHERHLNSHGKRQSNSSDNTQAGLPLFEKYQFLSPAIFMGLVVSLILLLILWVGVSAIAGLEVSYAAFSKDMGPAAQNKGKQQ